ncbi:MAG: hypothetical protein IPO60_03350 [Flavobacteriales bacterium]|nr:hypothetical protein [Flavobacteriales bacterium]MBK9597375.1 hypothetical protein [Flavobacteriales bacterium]QQS72029.1 MAG: hypothetical protein IPP95_12705 [Flavobacteriales bacterium]HQV38773.1 hypothetical protein [Flavobacteriales bacterium]HQW30956.1 hypothetical protein [Flavobacteriales bacterium]
MIKPRTLCAILALLSLSLAGSAQYQPVVFDPGSNLLGNGQPLPAEKQWSITGPVAPDIGIVEARIYEDAAMKHMATKGRWEQTELGNSPSFNINLDQKLRGNAKYTVVLGFYSSIGREASDTLAARLSAYLGAYVDQSVDVSSNRTRLTKPVGQVMDELSIIVRRGTDNYRSRLDMPFAGFSQLVEDKLARLNDTRLSDAKYLFKKKKDEDKRDQRIDMARHEIGAVKAMLNAELHSYLDREMMVLQHRTVLTDQATEHTPNTISLNVGYGGIYNSGTADDLSYGQAPYVGISFPLGRRAFSSRFWSNSSISLGAFVENTEDHDGTVVTGPLIDRPIYLGYGYRVFRMIRLNAGGTLVQKDTPNLDGGTSSSLEVRPFIGVSLEINLWLGIGK